MNEYDISEAFRRIENDLINSLIRNFATHRAEETKNGYDWDAWQVLQLRELEKFRKNNAHRFDDEFKDINDKIRGLFQESLARGENEADILGDTYLGDFSQPTFGINTERLNALIEATTNDLEKAEHAVLRKTNDEYRKIIFNAQVYANQGGTYEQAVDMATKDFRKNGIQSIVYKNGARHTIANYAEMALRTGGKRAYLMGLGNQMNRVGIHTVMVHRRNGACPFCTPWLGRVLVDDVYSGGTKEEARKKGLPLLSEAIDKGFLHPNCMDIYSMYVEGISKPEEPLTDEEKDELQKAYDLRQEINKAKGIRDSYERLAKTSLQNFRSGQGLAIDADNYLTLKDKWSQKVVKLEEELAKMNVTIPTESEFYVPPIDHSGIRELIDIEYDKQFKGVFEIPDGVLNIGEHVEPLVFTRRDGIERRDERWEVSLNKQISLPWEGFGHNGQMRLTWNLPDYRHGKPFLIQKKDFEGVRLTKKYAHGDLMDTMSSQWYAENGYEYLGRVIINKYNNAFTVDIGQKEGKQYLILDNIFGEETTVSQATIDKILAREKIVSKQLWDEGVRFRTLASRDGDAWVEAMEKFHTAVGADKPMSLVSKTAYDNVECEELYRGIAPVSPLRTDITMTKTTEECVEQLVKGGVGDCFPSRGIYGDSIAYTANDAETGFMYASPTKRGTRIHIPGGYIVRLKVKDDARTIEYKDAVELFNAINSVHPNDGSVYFSTEQRGSDLRREVGKAMQILGYDVIYEPLGDGHSNHFYIVLNRDALVAPQDDYVFAKITEEMAKRGRL